VARDRGADGIVATVDCDKSSPREKLSDLTAARQRDRTAGYHTPAALGEAIPHLEAWLIDDPVAVRGALQLQPATDIRSPTKIKSPKDELNQLHGQSASELFPLELLAAIATSLDPGRCNHQKDTGFEAFAAEVKAELGQLAPG
jgi:hypothetical protein